MRSVSFVPFIIRLAAMALLMTATPALSQADRANSPVEDEWLAAHNAARTEAGMALLGWSNRLAKDAAAWAKHLAEHELYEHATPDQRKGQGENLWRGPRDRWSQRDVIGFFIAEKRDFRFGTFPDISRTGRWSDVGHYSQVIWPETREVGCAVARTRSDEVLVCRYWPAGNIWGQRIDPPRQVRRR